MIKIDFFGFQFNIGRREQASVRPPDSQPSSSPPSTVYTSEESSDDQRRPHTTPETEDPQLVVAPLVQGTNHQTSNHSFDIDPDSVIKRSSFPVASGGLGDVYTGSLSRDASPEEPVAVKCPRFPNLSEPAIEKINHNLHREISIWATLKHQYVLPLYGTVKGFGPFPALVSPWMPNGTLTSYLDREDVTLTTVGKLHMLKQIAEGLKYLHDKDVTHGDLTGKNVLVAADGSPRLADFGISNIVVESNPAFSYHTGAVSWVAPELIVVPEGQTVQCATKSSDIYSLGCIMLHVLYGKLPYWWIKTALQVVKLKFDHKEPIINPTDIQARHLNFMRRCWSTNTESRPSVEEVLDFLEKAISDEAVST